MRIRPEIYQCNSIHLTAIDAGKNIHRQYSIETSTDLFGHTIVEWRWGRIGSRGQSRKISFDQKESAKIAVQRLLRRRDSAPKRIGVEYIQL